MAEKWITPLERDFSGKKYYSIADASYSDGRRRIKTKAYEAFLAKARKIERGEPELIKLYNKLKARLKRNPSVWEMHTLGETRSPLTRIRRILEKNNLPLIEFKGGLRDEIIQVYKELKTELGRSPKTSEVVKLVTQTKQSAHDLVSHVGLTLKKAGLAVTADVSKWEPEARAKAVETILETKRVEKFLSAADKKKLFADIKKYRSGARVGPEATMKIIDFAKYFPAGTSQNVISRQINRVANDILKLPEHPVFTKAESLAKRRAMEAVKRKGDPTGITKKFKGTMEMPMHHMRAKSISPALKNITHIDVITNSVKLRPYEDIRNSLLNEQRKVFRGQKSGWEKELEKLNFKARKYSNDIPRELRGLLYFEQMDKAGNLKAIGGNPMKSIAKLAPEGNIAFNTLTKENPIRKTILDFASAVKKGGGCRFLTGSQAGGAVATCTEIIKRDPVGSANKLAAMEATSGALGKVKKVATTFLGTLGKFGAKAAPLAAVAALGAVAEPLVKQFRNDDPSTYMTDIDQQKGVLLSLVEQETPTVDEEILKWQYPGQIAGAAAAVPGSKAVMRARKIKGMGTARAALGPVGKVLAGSFSPLGVAASLPIGIAAQRAGGTDYKDIATDPFNWMGPAFASAGSEMATKGVRNPLLLKALRLGMSPGAIRVGSRFLGLPGLALTAGMWGYDKWKNRDRDD